jgi:uncharacterized protein (TIGR03435 family)
MVGLLAILNAAMRRSPALYARVAAIAAGVAIAVPVAALQPRDTGTQVPPTIPSFDVASVRANVGSDRSMPFSPNPPDGIAFTNRPLESIIRLAYEVQPFRVLGLPGWAHEERFDITAKAAAPISEADRRLMMRSLLVDRFRLRAHFEPREQTVYVLTRLNPDGAYGPGLRPRPECVKAADCQGGGNGSRAAGRVTLSAVTLEQLASGMLSLMTDGVVRDETCAEGLFDVSLSWRPDGPGVTADPADARPSFFTAMEEQLGLKLTAQRRPVDMLVIESIDRPTRD